MFSSLSTVVDHQCQASLKLRFSQQNKIIDIQCVALSFCSCLISVFKELNTQNSSGSKVILSFSSSSIEYSVREINKNKQRKESSVSIVFLHSDFQEHQTVVTILPSSISTVGSNSVYSAPVSLHDLFFTSLPHMLYMLKRPLYTLLDLTSLKMKWISRTHATTDNLTSHKITAVHESNSFV